MQITSTAGLSHDARVAAYRAVVVRREIAADAERLETMPTSPMRKFLGKLNVIRAREAERLEAIPTKEIALREAATARKALIQQSIAIGNARAVPLLNLLR